MKYKHKVKNIIAESREHQATINLRGYLAGGTWLPAWVVEDSQDWEKIKEPTYEVVKLKCNNGVISTFDKPNMLCYKDRDEWVKLFLAAKIGWEIWSVKRISDGEVFTIGDRVKNPGLGAWIIGLFYIKEDKLLVDSETGATCPDFYQLEKDKILFYTTDGVPVYKRTKIYIVYGEFSSIPFISTMKVEYWLPDEKKFFSTYEKAQEYTNSLIVKPLFVTEDGIDVFPNNTNDVWCLSPDFKNLSSGHALDITTGFAEPKSGYKFFADKKNAENYIFLNSNVLSLKDIAAFTTHVKFTGVYTNVEYTKLDVTELEKLVRARI